MKLDEIRQKYPQYANVPDAQLAKGLHAKFYPKMDFNEFSQRIGVDSRQSRRDALKAQNPAEYDPESQEYKAKYGATSGMSAGEKIAANIGAGATDFARGAAQLALPKFLERKVGITDESTQEKRSRDQDLAESIPGGGALQAVGNIAPSLLVPVGAVTRGLTALPKIGAALRAGGVGTRALPTLAAEGAATGAVLGAAAPTLSDETTVGRAAVGAVGGAVIPGALMGAGWAGKKIAPGFLGGRKLAERAVSRELTGKTAKGTDKAIKDLKGYERNVRRGIDEPPLTTAAVTQNHELALTENAMRATPRFQSDWAKYDDVVSDTRWDILDRNLGSAQGVDDAMDITRKFADAEVPKYFRRVNKKEFGKAADDFNTGLSSLLRQPDVISDPAARSVFGHILSTQKRLKNEGYDWSPSTLWRERKVLSGWLSGKPPPGKEAVRAPNLDRYLMQARNAIDEVLNRSSKKEWSKFLEAFGERMKGEAQQKAGLNIRNVFMDDVLQVARGTPTETGSPRVTERAIKQAYSRFGKNQFGPMLDTAQDDAVRTVMGNIERSNVTQRAKSSTTGGGSQTAPLAARMAASDLLGQRGNAVMQLLNRREQKIMNDALQNPQIALRLLQGGKVQLSPLAREQLQAIAYGTRATIGVAAAQGGQ